MVSNADALVASWSDNAALWTRAVREGRIASRRDATDAAILAAVRRAAPRRLLDVGCGEGWLCRALADTGAAMTGVDATLEFVAQAAAASDGAFLSLGYAELAAAPEQAGADFDVIVCNFSLLDDKVKGLLAALARIAAPDATLLIQTVHPLAAGPPYADGWRTESFESFEDGGWTAMPWYFRTFAAWIEVLAPAWTLRALEEPRPADIALPASLLLTARLTTGRE